MMKISQNKCFKVPSTILFIQINELTFKIIEVDRSDIHYFKAIIH